MHPTGCSSAADEWAPALPLTNPLEVEAMEKAIQEVLEQWSKGSFTAQRAIYDNDDSVAVAAAVAAAVENALWVS